MISNVTERNAMINQVNDLTKFKSVESDARAPANQEAATQKTAPEHSVSDVNLSKISKHIEALKASAMDQDNDIDVDRVNTVKEQLEAGNYQINSKQIAAKMVAEIA